LPPIGIPAAGKVTGDQPGIVFRNQLSGAFRLTRALFVLDGAVVFHRHNLYTSLPSEILVYSGAPPVGGHVLQVLLQLQGEGEAEASYLSGYKFEIKSSHSFTVKESQALHVEVIAWERGNERTPLERRPALRYLEGFKSDSVAAGPTTERAPSP
jgi:hypothetical protein